MSALREEILEAEDTQPGPSLAEEDPVEFAVRQLAAARVLIDSAIRELQGRRGRGQPQQPELRCPSCESKQVGQQRTFDALAYFCKECGHSWTA